MSNKKQNSLEWYIEETFKLSVKFERQEISQKEYTLGYSNLLQQAKAMHKEEIQSAIIYAEREHNILGNVWPTQTVLDKAEEYYNETFGGEDE